MKKKNIIITVVSIVVTLAIAIGTIFAPAETERVLDVVGQSDSISRCAEVVAECVGELGAIPDGSTHVGVGVDCLRGLAEHGCAELLISLQAQ